MSIHRRGIGVLAGAGALLVACCAMASQAQAATTYACVKKKGGSVRLVSKTSKCKKGESKV